MYVKYAYCKKKTITTQKQYLQQSMKIKYQVNVLCALSITVDLTNSLFLPSFVETTQT